MNDVRDVMVYINIFTLSLYEALACLRDFLLCNVGHEVHIVKMERIKRFCVMHASADALLMMLRYAHTSIFRHGLHRISSILSRSCVEQLNKLL